MEGWKEYGPQPGVRRGRSSPSLKSVHQVIQGSKSIQNAGRGLGAKPHPDDTRRPMRGRPSEEKNAPRALPCRRPPASSAALRPHDGHHHDAADQAVWHQAPHPARRHERRRWPRARRRRHQRRRHGRHRRCRLHPRLPAPPDRRDQGEPRGQERALWRGPAAPPGRRQRPRDQLRLHGRQAPRADRHHHRGRRQAVRVGRGHPAKVGRGQAAQGGDPRDEHDRRAQARPQGHRGRVRHHLRPGRRGRRPHGRRQHRHPDPQGGGHLQGPQEPPHRRARLRDRRRRHLRRPRPGHGPRPGRAGRLGRHPLRGLRRGRRAAAAQAGRGQRGRARHGADHHLHGQADAGAQERVHRRLGGEQGGPDQEAHIVGRHPRQLRHGAHAEGGRRRGRPQAHDRGPPAAHGPGRRRDRLDQARQGDHRRDGLGRRGADQADELARRRGRQALDLPAIRSVDLENKLLRSHCRVPGPNRAEAAPRRGFAARARRGGHSKTAPLPSTDADRATMPARKSNLPVVFGSMTFGEAGKEQARVHDAETCTAILNSVLAHGHDEIDTARTYCGGTCEQYLGNIGTAEMGFRIQTKLYPTTGQRVSGSIVGQDPIEHTPEGLRKHLMRSLEALRVRKLDMWYLHGPDRKTPYGVTLKAVDELHREGYFDRFGISNYYSWEVAEMVTLCRANGWIQPTVYQGIYNVINRTVEAELFPCMRKFGISFYAFNPLGGGLLTGRYSKDTSEIEKGSRFDPERTQGKFYRARYFNDATFAALEVIRKACEEHKLTMAEVALRWMNHHSAMKPEHGDAVIIGASSVAHIEANMADLDKGPLPESILPALDEAWEIAKATAAPYWH